MKGKALGVETRTDFWPNLISLSPEVVDRYLVKENRIRLDEATNFFEQTLLLSEEDKHFTNWKDLKDKWVQLKQTKLNERYTWTNDKAIGYTINIYRINVSVIR